jgi:cysteine desulfurase family protein
MDNAATSFPKPAAVTEAMTDYAHRLGASPARGAYAEAKEAGRLVRQCRERLNTLFNGESADHVIFTLNTTDALNLAIRGLVREGDHVVTTAFDHNSVLRPFNALTHRGIVTQTQVACDPETGLVDPEAIRAAIQSNTRLVAMVHGSNVTGTLQRVESVGAICREADVALVVDAAQTAGHVPIDVQRDNIDLLAFPGHKGLLGPLGTGGLYIRPGVEQQMQTVREGGTGSVSETPIHPDFMPDRFEAGSHNAIGLIGLSAGVQWLLDQGVDELWQHEQRLIQIMLDWLHEADMPGLHLYGPPTAEHRCGVFSIRIDSYEEPVHLSQALEKQFGILTRSGVHCAPLAHETLGTHELGGTTRFSFGPFLSEADVHRAGEALQAVCQAQAALLG